MTLQWGQVVNKQLAIQVVDLVLQADGEQAFQLACAFQALRRERLAAPSEIAVSVDDVRIDERSPVEVEVSFLQSYRSDRFSDRVRKRLQLELEGATWRIVREVSLPLESAVTED